MSFLYFLKQRLQPSDVGQRIIPLDKRQLMNHMIARVMKRGGNRRNINEIPIRLEPATEGKKFNVYVLYISHEIFK